jgi:hypothetical protein
MRKLYGVKGERVDKVEVGTIHSWTWKRRADQVMSGQAYVW